MLGGKLAQARLVRAPHLPGRRSRGAELPLAGKLKTDHDGGMLVHPCGDVLAAIEMRQDVNARLCFGGPIPGGLKVGRAFVNVPVEMSYFGVCGLNREHDPCDKAVAAADRREDALIMLR